MCVFQEDNGKKIEVHLSPHGISMVYGSTPSATALLMSFASVLLKDITSLRAGTMTPPPKCLAVSRRSRKAGALGAATDDVAGYG